MSNFFTRQSAAFRNELNRSLGALVGIAQGVVADGNLTDGEIQFLHEWLRQNEAIAATWPGDVIAQRVQQVMAYGKISEDERTHLINTLKSLIGGTLEELAATTHVTQLALDSVDRVHFAGARFCLTGEFVFAPRPHCEEQIVKRGGEISSVTKKLTYLIVGGLGSPEWKHGSFGTKIEKAMQYKRQGLGIMIVHEDIWAQSL